MTESTRLRLEQDGERWQLTGTVVEYIDWFNFRRLHGQIGLVPPVEFETQHQSTTLLEQPAQRELEASIKPGT